MRLQLGHFPRKKAQFAPAQVSSTVCDCGCFPNTQEIPNEFQVHRGKLAKLAPSLLLPEGMKTSIKTLLLSFVVVLAAVGCGKKKDSNINPNYYGQGAYGGYQSNGQYIWDGSRCYIGSTGQTVDSNQYCRSYNSGYPNQGGTITQVCQGQYIYMGYGYPQQGTCNGSNCSGYTLMEVSTQRWVNCQ